MLRLVTISLLAFIIGAICAGHYCRWNPTPKVKPDPDNGLFPLAVIVASHYDCMTNTDVEKYSDEIAFSMGYRKLTAMYLFQKKVTYMKNRDDVVRTVTVSFNSESKCFSVTSRGEVMRNGKYSGNSDRAVFEIADAINKQVGKRLETYLPDEKR